MGKSRNRFLVYLPVNLLIMDTLTYSMDKDMKHRNGHAA
jgi:hypothetical protein